MNSLAPELDIDPYARENLLDPYPMHERLREAGPVLRLTRYGIFGCARHAEVRATLNDHENFISSAGVGLANFNTETPFRPRSLILEADGRENLLIYGDMVFNSMGPRNELLAKATEKVGPVTDWIMSHCERSRLRPNGFGDQIYQVVDSGELSAEQAPLLVRSFLSAGVDTTINGLGNALYALANHPDEYAQLHADPSLARPAFEEGLRWESTAQTFFRTAGRDAEIAGVPIPANSKVLLFLAAANRDARKSSLSESCMVRAAIQQETVPCPTSP